MKSSEERDQEDLEAARFGGGAGSVQEEEDEGEGDQDHFATARAAQLLHSKSPKFVVDDHILEDDFVPVVAAPLAIPSSAAAQNGGSTDSGRGAALAMRLLQNLRNERSERDRLQQNIAAAEVAPAVPLTAIIQTGAGGSPHLPRRDSTGSPHLRRESPAMLRSPMADSPRKVSEFTALPTANGVKRNSKQKSFEIKYLPEDAPAAAVPDDDGREMKERLMEARKKLRPVSFVEEDDASAGPVQCTFLGDCKCEKCKKK